MSIRSSLYDFNDLTFHLVFSLSILFSECIFIIQGRKLDLQLIGEIEAWTIKILDIMIDILLVGETLGGLNLM